MFVNNGIQMLEKNLFKHGVTFKMGLLVECYRRDIFTGIYPNTLMLTSIVT